MGREADEDMPILRKGNKRKRVRAAYVLLRGLTLGEG